MPRSYWYVIPANEPPRTRIFGTLDAVLPSVSVRHFKALRKAHGAGYADAWLEAFQARMHEGVVLLLAELMRNEAGPLPDHMKAPVAATSLADMEAIILKAVDESRARSDSVGQQVTSDYPLA